MFRETIRHRDQNLGPHNRMSLIKLPSSSNANTCFGLTYLPLLVD